MFLQRIRQTWARLREEEQRDRAGIHSQSTFRSILEVERMRTDRSSRPFCLAVFTLSDEIDAPMVTEFALNLRKNIRATDHIGFLQNEQLGIVLWDTRPEGAWKFLEKIEGLRNDIGAVTCEVFQHPNEIVPDQSEDNQASSNDDGSALNDTASGIDLPDDLLIGVRRSSFDQSTGLASESDALLVSTDVQIELKTKTETEIEIDGNLQRAERLVDELVDLHRGIDPQQSAQPLEAIFVRPMPVWKRMIDMTGAAIGLLMLSPVLLATAIVIKLTSNGPVLFSQLRTGRGGKPFRIYKFRSMVIDAEAKQAALMEQNEQDGPAFKIKNDPRITGIGKFIRKTSIDELPQLWNVLTGDMSLVGPRPLPCHESDACLSWQRRRLDVTPGLTCTWQIQDERNSISFGDWTRMDLSYIGSRTITTDVELIFRTFGTVFGRKGS